MRNIPMSPYKTSRIQTSGSVFSIRSHLHRIDEFLHRQHAFFWDNSYRKILVFGSSKFTAVDEPCQSPVFALRELDFENVVAEKDSMIMEKFVYAMEMRLDPELKSNGFNSGCFAEAHRNASHNRISE